MIKIISFDRVAPIFFGLNSNNTASIESELSADGLYDCFDAVLCCGPDMIDRLSQSSDDICGLNSQIVASSFDQFSIFIVCTMLINHSSREETLSRIEELCSRSRVRAYVCRDSASRFGDIPHQFSRLVRAYNECADDLGNCTKCFHRVSDTESCNSTMVDPQKLKTMVQLFENGKLDKLESEIDSTIERIRTSNYHMNSLVTPTSIKRFFLELILFVIHSAYDRGVDVDRIMDYADPYQVIFSFNETPEIKEWCMRIMKKLYDACSISDSPSREKLADFVDRYVKANLSDSNLSVGSIADEIGLSQAYLSNCYSTIRGGTLIKHINDERMALACSYLSNTGMTINDVYHSIGFLSESYFYTTFKKYYGVSPSEYRKNKK